MGIGPFSKGCFTNDTITTAPNPSPSKWTLLDKQEYDNAYILKVQYDGCTNFEGVKVMVFKGQYQQCDYLDPHFSDGDDSPVARFKPTIEGMMLATNLARSL